MIDRPIETNREEQREMVRKAYFMQKPPSNPPLIPFLTIINGFLFILNHFHPLSLLHRRRFLPPTVPHSFSTIIFRREVSGFLQELTGERTFPLCSTKVFRVYMMWRIKWWGLRNQDSAIYICSFTDWKLGGSWRIMEGVGEMKLRKTLMTLIESGLSSVTLLIFHCKRKEILSVRHYNGLRRRLTRKSRPP